MKNLEKFEELELKKEEKVIIYGGTGGDTIDDKYEEWKDGYYA